MKRYRLFIAIATLGAVVGVVRCGGGGADSAEALRGEPTPALRWKKNPNDVTPFQNGLCRVSDAIEPVSPPTHPARTLWVRGGGWEGNSTLSTFTDHLTSGQYAALILSATSASGNTNTQYFLKYYKERMPGVRVQPIYTRQASDAENANYVSVVKGASAILITGGYPDNLRHLVRTALGRAIQQAYLAGIPVYTNSASTSLVGSLFAWDLNQKIQSGLSLLKPAFLSHLERSGHPEQLWGIVPKRLQQSFGVWETTTAVIEDQVLTVYGEGSTTLVFVYDQEFPRSAKCRYWVLQAGESFPVK